jgi:hypothetical protein
MLNILKQQNGMNIVNPIYSSATFFILPAVTLPTLTWVYLVVSVFVCVGVMIFIRPEERQLTEVFGTEYRQYMARVDRLIPFKKARLGNHSAGRPGPGTARTRIAYRRPSGPASRTRQVLWDKKRVPFVGKRTVRCRG